MHGCAGARNSAFLGTMFGTALLHFFRTGFVTKVSVSRNQSAILFEVQMLQDRSSRKVQQTTQQRNVEKTALHLFATRYSLGVQNGIV